MTRTAPLAFGQQLFYQLDQATPGLIAYNVPRAFRVQGALNVPALRAAFEALVERHTVLRSVYAQDGDHYVQRVMDGVAVPFDTVDLSGLPRAERESALARQLAERAAYHFDLGRDVLLRAALYTLGADEHVLFFLTHHIVSDGWSKSITFDELSELYAASVEGRAPALAPLPMQFADHAERERAGDEALEEHLAYWRTQLAGPLPVLDLPTDRARPTGHSFEGGARHIVLPQSLVDRLRAFGQEQGATLYMVLLAAYQTLLSRYSGQDDIITGSPTAGRDAEETQGLIGYFAGALVMRNSFAGDPSFSELLARVVDTSLDAYEHQDIPFERLVTELQAGQQLTHAPLYQCVLTMEDTIPASLRLAGSTVKSMDVGVSTTKFDLTLLFSEVPDGLRLRLAFRTALFDADRIERMLGHLRTLLEAAVANPETKVSALPLLTEPERHQLLVEWSGAATPPETSESVVRTFERHAAQYATRVAARGEDGELTFGALNAQANRIAHTLTARGVAPGACVGICLDRTAGMIAAMLGVMKAGAAFVPLLPDLPAPRLRTQLRDSAVSCVVTVDAYRTLVGDAASVLLLDREGDALAGAPDGNPATASGDEDLAYVLFTSGSTGTPKGVAITHANIAHYTHAIAKRMNLPLDGSAHWQFATVSTLGADLGHTAIFPSLASAGTLHVLPSSVTSDPTQFALYASVNPIDVLKITPNHLRALIGNASTSVARLPARWLVSGGEALPWAFALELARMGDTRVLNHYGPTEATVGATTYEVAPDAQPAGASVPIGMPLHGAHVYVRDAHGEPSPVGVPGELYIGGAGVARGYVGREDLTAERFLTFNGERVYRTGDRVRWSSAGALEFLGRTDEQVKVRGYRVELAEIEHVLRRNPAVSKCAVMLRAVPGAEPALIAYVVPRQGGYATAHAALSAHTLLASLEAELPYYMVPSRVVFLDELPLNRNGKLDRDALPDPEGGNSADDAFIGPRTDTENAIAAIWCDVLKRDQVSVTESFLDLGGHSLLAIRVLGKISKQLGVRLALRALFETPTVEQLAHIVDVEVAQREAEKDLAAALAQIEHLSDADVARLLENSASTERDKG